MNKGRVNDKYEEKYIKSNRTFPVGNTVLLVILIAIQIGVLFWAFTHEPKPQDVIQEYHVIVNPQRDGSLDITYTFVWEALDEDEPLTWVELGMANENFVLYSDTLSANIADTWLNTNDAEVLLGLEFDREYTGGDVFRFRFTVNQKDMLCKDDYGYFYEFVPGWFNAAQVENYEFRWVDRDNEHTWTGSLDYGEYETMYVRYDADAFKGCETVDYRPFNDSGAYNQLEADRESSIVLAVMLVLAIVAAEVYITDCYVSYHRGRGFLTGHGYHIHTYGRSNPWYIKARDKYNAKHHHSGRSHGGRGCACACACACAGGGRAGCSQKDGYGNSKS